MGAREGDEVRLPSNRSCHEGKQQLKKSSKADALYIVRVSQLLDLLHATQNLRLGINEGVAGEDIYLRESFINRVE
jgi:hypothetical protein